MVPPEVRLPPVVSLDVVLKVWPGALSVFLMPRYTGRGVTVTVALDVLRPVSTVPAGGVKVAVLVSVPVKVAETLQVTW